jgi:hypothetical protein
LVSLPVDPVRQLQALDIEFASNEILSQLPVICFAAAARQTVNGGDVLPSPADVNNDVSQMKIAVEQKF